MSDYHTATCADSRKLIGWLWLTGALHDGVLGVGHERWTDETSYAEPEVWIQEAVQHARTKRRPTFSFPFVDRLLTRLGLHVSEVPEDVWIEVRDGAPCVRCGGPRGETNPECFRCVDRARQRRRRSLRVAA